MTTDSQLDSNTPHDMVSRSQTHKATVGGAKVQTTRAAPGEVVRPGAMALTRSPCLCSRPHPQKDRHPHYGSAISCRERTGRKNPEPRRCYLTVDRGADHLLGWAGGERQALEPKWRPKCLTNSTSTILVNILLVSNLFALLALAICLYVPPPPFYVLCVSALLQRTAKGAQGGNLGSEYDASDRTH